ncbi:cytochrome P450 4F3-like [Pecten maximus]|uniref:cytochrome P450 4F3-like n=1 Tax=Pecten maximus TaxID=6579 RepID=UPI001458D6A6|nr:cytochrome P450 4F3-like [Pecten maximus]XP_033748158.1 cytochrome P450 4F3-like [Pecten maximus]XP_033748159.1 cytochrome P450 4F3-like [Pecten maximus]
MITMDLSMLILCTILLIFLLWKGSAIVRTHRTNSALFSSRQVLSIGKRHPIFGHLHLMPDFTEYLRLVDKGIQDTGKKISGFWIMFFYPIFSLCHPETAKVILKTAEPKPVQTGGGYFAFLPWLGNGLLVSSGRHWDRNRRLLNPAFHLNVLKPYVVTFNKVFDKFLTKMEKAASDGKGVEVSEPAGMATLDTVLRCAFSFDEDIQEAGSRHPYVDSVQNIVTLAGARMLKPWLYPELFFRLSADGRNFFRHVKYVHDFDEKVIQQRRQSMAVDASTKTKGRLDFLDILLTARDDNDTGLTDREIRDEVDTFLFGGHDTTAAAISWTMYLCSKHPEEQQKLYDEVQRVVGEKPQVEWSDIQEMSRLSLFLKESLRMYAPACAVARITTKEHIVDGLTLPANTEVNILIDSINHREDIWKDPETFRPDRFEDSDRDPYSFVPFSAGPRNCIGQNFAMTELKVAISKIIKRFRILPDLDHETIPRKEAVLRSKSGVWVKLEKRHQS